MKPKRNNKQSVLSDNELMLKQAASSSYRKAVKKLVQQVKTLKNIYRIPNLPERPNKPGQTQDLYDKKASKTFTKKSLRFWLTPLEFEDNRRVFSDKKEIDSDIAPKDSLRY